MEWAQETIEVPQPPKKTPTQCHMGIKVETSWLSQDPKMRKLGIIPQGSWNLLSKISGMYTYKREPDEESARSWTYRSRESDGTGGICILPSDIYKNNHRFHSKRKQQDEEVKIANELNSAECIIPLSFRRHSSYQSPWDRPQWEATLPRCCWRPQQATASTAPR